MNKKLLFIMGLAFLIELYFFALAVGQHQTEWWDSTEYLLKAKSMALGTSDIGFAAHREIIPALVYYPFFKLGLGEFGIRVFMFAIGMLGVYLTYKIGKAMFNENIGLLSSLMMATFYLYIFNMNRLTMYVVAPVLFTSAMYCFWKYYSENKINFLYYSFLIIGVGITIYYNTAFALMVIGAFFLLTNRQFYKNKHIWLAGILTLFVLSPYFIYSQLTFGSPLPRLSETMRAAATEGGAPILQAIVAYPKIIPGMLLAPWLVLVILGVLVSYKFFFGLDLIVKGQLKEEQPRLILFLWILIPLIMYAWTVATLGGGTVVYPEYIMLIFPAFFMIASLGIMFVYEKLGNISKALAVGFICVALISGMFLQLNLADQTFKSKLGAYKEIQEAADIIKSRSVPTDWVVTASVPQMVYYSERPVTGIARDINESEWIKETFALKPKFLFWSVYEPLPDWFYGYMQNSTTDWVPIKGWGTQDQPIAILFQSKGAV
jgi:4-amino-4-deoxy-L-arabinose transferase-like glycosyltransferase